MLSSKVLRYVDRTLQDVCGTVEPFGGKVVVLGGDWRQLAPVVEHGTREDQVLESIKMEPLFSNFEKLRFQLRILIQPSVL
jgi:ATP-dependent DNA helicase PIF1